MSEFQKKIISWKEADKALCMLAFSILENLHKELRHPEGTYPSDTYPIADGTHISGGFMTNTNQTWWSSSKPKVLNMGEGGFMAHYPKDDAYFKEPSAVCWYSMQNLTRQRLRDARAKLAKALLPQRKRKKTSSQSSRNALKRK